MIRNTHALGRTTQLDTPDGALNRAFAGAARSAGDSVRAEEGGGFPDWDASDLAHLRAEARAFDRVGPQALPDPGEFLRDIVSGLFGAAADLSGGRFALTPWLVEGWRRMALRRLRLHRTLVDVEVRPRADWATIRLEVTFSPPVPLALSVRNGGPVSRVTVDEVVLLREPVVFTLSGEHEAMFFFSGR